jgi:hypothetical protein
MIAAADLEDAEFQHDRLVLACGEAIRQALAAGSTYLQIAQAANMTEAEVRRHAEAPSVGPDVLEELVVPFVAERPVPAFAEAARPQEDPTVVDLAGSAAREPDAAL